MDMEMGIYIDIYRDIHMDVTKGMGMTKDIGHIEHTWKQTQKWWAKQPDRTSGTGQSENDRKDSRVGDRTARTE
jgi:hypothetical protein